MNFVHLFGMFLRLILHEHNKTHVDTIILVFRSGVGQGILELSSVRILGV